MLSSVPAFYNAIRKKSILRVPFHQRVLRLLEGVLIVVGQRLIFGRKRFAADDIFDVDRKPARFGVGQKGVKFNTVVMEIVGGVLVDRTL